MKKWTGFFVLLVLTSLVLQACKVSVPSFLATPTPTSTSTPLPTATRTATPTRTPYPSITPNARATREADEMFAIVQQMKADGYIDDTAGTYYKLDDLQINWAKIYYYYWEYLYVDGDYPIANNFIIRAD